MYTRALTSRCGAGAFVVINLVCAHARAAEPGEAPSVEATAPPSAPYALPFQLRPAVAVTVVRVDGAVALHDRGTTLGSVATVSYRLAPDFAALARAGLGSNWPDAGGAKAALLNPLFGVLYAPKVADGVRLAPFAAVALPFGQGGGSAPAPATAAAIGATRLARSSLDNALVAVNYTTLVGGLGVAYVKGGLTLQAEATFLYGLRSRGPSTQDETVANATFGASAGYFVLPELSLQVELRHQHFLSTPVLVKKDTSARDQTTAAVGPRFHLPLGGGKTARPGFAYARPLDDPMRGGYQVFFVDLALTF